MRDQPRTTRQDMVNDLKRAGTTVSKKTISNTLCRQGEGLYGGVGQNPCCSVCKPDQELQETYYLCNCKHRFVYQILSSAFLMYQILMSCNKMQIKYLKIIQCDFLDFCFRFRLSQLKCTYDKNYRPLHAM